MTNPASEDLPFDMHARPPSFREMSGAWLRMLRRRGNPWGRTDLDDLGAAAILNRDPLVIYTAAGTELPLGMANGLRPQLAGIPATFLIGVHGSLERFKKARRIRRAAMIHRARHPEHRFVILCNTRAEQKKMLDLGEPAVFLNHNMLIGVDEFFPIEPANRIYDAVYNGRLSPQKRHHLALHVQSCAMIFFRSTMEDPAFEKAVLTRHGAEAPGHVFINRMGPDGPIWMSESEVNHVYNQAHVGLCLSEVEGAMYSSIEYMLAGLPVVSTHSFGGRDVYFDPEYCIVTEPNPAAIRDAVQELKTRNIPRDYVRARTLAKIAADRTRFLDFLVSMQVSLPEDARKNWPYPSKLITWRPWRAFLPELPERKPGPKPA